jgi:glycolate oxidase iron-sulfur subunit
VPYGHLLEATRATLAETRPIPPLARFILTVFAHPALRRIGMAGARIFRATRLPRLLAHLPGQLGFASAMLASTSPAVKRGRYVPPTDGTRGSCALLRGCVMEGLYQHTNEATARTLAVNGYTMADAPGQGCCGALHAHAGDLKGARKLARKNVAAFSKHQSDFIVVNAAGCGSMMKEYGHLLHDDPEWAARAESVAARVRDVSELLAAAGPVRGGELPLRVTYDAPCHLLHAQRVVDPPLRMLAAIPGLVILPLTDADQCCGSAGIYNLIEPDTSDRVLHVKMNAIRNTEADFVATGNPGCLMQIGAGLRRNLPGVHAVHPVDLLDASYNAR